MGNPRGGGHLVYGTAPVSRLFPAPFSSYVLDGLSPSQRFVYSRKFFLGEDLGRKVVEVHTELWLGVSKRPGVVKGGISGFI